MRDTKVMADRLAARTAGESRWGSTGRGMVARYLPGQEQTGPPKGGGRMRMLGGDSTGQATGSVAANRVRNALKEAACPAEEAPSCPCCQPVTHSPSYHAPPGPACRRFFSPSLSSTVVIPAFVPIHRLGSSTLFGLAVRSQHVDLQSSHGGGAPRIILLPISSRTYDLIHYASASATNSASYIACPS